MNLWIGLLLGMSLGLGHAAEPINKISLPLIQDMQRADLYSLKLDEHPAAILVLCPGVNGNGDDWVEDPKWQDFARRHHLDLLGLSFASEGALLRQNRGYYEVSQGSGQLLLDGIHQIYGQDRALILYGFSGGAHFVSQFTEWHPANVLAWCAYSAEWWKIPVRNSSSPPGLIVCGEQDERYGASLLYFEQGRALGKRWLWLSAGPTAHAIYPPAENFIRDYLAAELSSSANRQGQWIDLDFKTRADNQTLQNQPTLTGWLPDTALMNSWKDIQEL
jgi:hypothetical protein